MCSSQARWITFQSGNKRNAKKKAKNKDNRNAYDQYARLIMLNVKRLVVIICRFRMENGLKLITTTHTSSLSCILYVVTIMASLIILSIFPFNFII